MINLRDEAYQAWWSIAEEFPWAIQSMNIDMVKVSPKTKRIEDDETQNTLVNYWIEGGPIRNVENWPIPEHDIRLDCGADTFEEAIIKYYKLLKKYYYHLKLKS